jgi:RNA polymerase sigma-70 factor (ECF subfamily)
VEILTQVEADVDQPWSAQERRRVARLCVALTGDPTAAEDLAQETLLQAWRIRDRLVDPSGQGPWLDAIARHVCRRWRSRQARLAGHEVVTDRPADHAGAAPVLRDDLADVLEKEEMAELLERALVLLPPETRDVLVARHVDDLGPAEIGSRLGLSPEAVSMRLTRGRARLRLVLETELADEPLARVWVGRHGAAWRSTRMSCTRCGHPTTSMRRDHHAGVLQLRCDACDPVSLASSWSLDNPVLGPQLEAVQRPTAVVARMSAWAHAWWLPAIETGQVPCTRCSAVAVVRPYTRPDVDDVEVKRGWTAGCQACGEELTSSFLGLALAFPETRALCRRRPRAHAVPTRQVEVDGRPTVVVAVRDDASGDQVEVLYDDATSRIRRLVASL